MNTIDLDVQGMTCGACVQRVTSALMPVDGVHDVAVDLKAGRVRVTSDATVPPSQLIAALNAKRYESQVSAHAAEPSALTATPAVKAARKGGCCCG